MSVTQYLSKVNNFVDALSVAGERIGDTDLVILVLAGLREDYQTLIQNVTSIADKSHIKC